MRTGIERVAASPSIELADFSGALLHTKEPIQRLLISPQVRFVVRLFVFYRFG